MPPHTLVPICSKLYILRTHYQGKGSLKTLPGLSGSVEGSLCRRDRVPGKDLHMGGGMCPDRELNQSIFKV